MARPHDYQIRAFKFGLQQRSSFMMIDAGMGKTLISLMFLRALQRPAIVMAPLRPITITWPNEINKWFPGMRYTILHGAAKQNRLKNKSDIFLINYEGLPWFFQQCCNGVFPLRKFPLIFDESTFFKEPNTTRFKILKKMHPMFSQYRMALSATPAPIGYHNLWGQYFMLDGGRRLGPSYTRFRDLHFNFSGPPYFKTTLKGPAEKKIIFDKVRDITFRLAAEDYLKMPELYNITHVIKFPANLREIYHKLENDLEAVFDDGFTVRAFNDVMKNGKLRQFMQGAMYDAQRNYKVFHTLKIELLKTLIHDLQGDPLLVPIQFRFEIDMIKKVFPKAAFVVGGTSVKDSASIIRRWNLGYIPLLVCHPRSLSHGMNLQAVGHTILWLGLPHSLEDYQQLWKRLWRQGQSRPVMNHHAVMEGTIDERMLTVLYDRNATQQDLFEAMTRRFTHARSR